MTAPNHDVARRYAVRARAAAAAATALLATALAAGPAGAADVNATPSNFSSVFSAARAGDVIHLAAGDYGTFTGGSKSGPVTITGAGADMYANLGASQNLILDGLTIEGLATNGAKNLTIRNSTFTAATVIQTPTSTPNANILIDHNTFANINVCSTCYEGRLAVRGYQNTQPVGVTISNNTFGPNGDADGIQIVGGAYGVQIGPGNEFHDLLQVSQAHTDPIQLYGSTHTLITGNWLHGNATGIMAPDGSDHETITNNVIQTTSYPWPVVMGAAEGNVVSHNVFPGSGGTVEVDKSNAGDASSGNTVKDNVLANVANSTGGAPQGTTSDYNLASGGTRGSHDIKARPTFAGGSSPTSWAGYALAAGSTGTGKADDGTAMGIVPGAAGTPSNPGAAGTTPAPAPSPTASTSATTAPPAVAPAPLIGAGVSPLLAVKRSISHVRFTKRLRFALLVKRSASPVSRISFMVDGRWVATDRRAPFALSWKVPRTTRYGTHVLTVKAFAADGSVGTLSAKVRRVR
ncbi:right-handed parallel beta-helix repeat-containing protein [Conexibacter woesei]|uniref:right-handed parallel beta-helix repeat-containing protein n=1 Tax=Conexibacter woesei TaxID=191495 RepID=UPI00042009FB|nr:right-handed parallel beta-helix repeat-containing protein [Conexibacter woesei]